MTVLTRAFIKRCGGALLMCTAVVGCLLAAAPAAASASGCRPPKTAWKFVSAPSLHPTHVHVCTHKKSASAGLVFIGPFHDAAPNGRSAGPLVGQAGALIVDAGGNPVWFHRAPKGDQDSDLQTDTYYTSPATPEPVISFWQGKIALPPTNLAVGAPIKGSFLVYDQHYHLVKTIKAVGKGWITDFHELILTKGDTSHPQGTAIFLAAKKVSANLRKYGGPANGSFEDEEIQQIDVATGTLIFHWDVHHNISLRASKVHPKAGQVWDAYHANSINMNSAGDLLLSLRNTWGVYNLKPTGSSSAKFVWKLINGKGSNYSLSKSARFFWQHDVRFDGSNKVSMFDDGCCNLGVSGPEHAARGLVLRLSKGHATMARQVHHYNTREVPTAGSFRVLASGHAFVGWGQSYYYSEYSKTNRLLYDAAMPKPDMSYRAFKGQWTGMPTSTPAAAARKASGKVNVYASWNGATTVAKWKVLEGQTQATVIHTVGHANRSGFETTIRVAGNKGPWYEVQALDSHGTPIPGGMSKPVKVK